MPRALHHEEAGATYHVTTHSVDEALMVRSDRDRKAFLETVATVVLRYRWELLAVSVLDNHYHLLVRTPLANLAPGMQYLNGTYAQAFNRRHGRRGHLFRARYYRKRVVTDAHLVLTIRYIALNRMEAGIVPSPRPDRWSSYPGVVGPSPCWPFVARAVLLGFFGPQERAIRRLIAFVEGPRALGRRGDDAARAP
ncbi:MAG TPA: transposase [Gaiellaceae bacterium]|jgi:REP element-mobilizing transposase RayT